jgi:hypothetical protein
MDKFIIFGTFSQSTSRMLENNNMIAKTNQIVLLFVAF